LKIRSNIIVQFGAGMSSFFHQILSWHFCMRVSTSRMLVTWPSCAFVNPDDIWWLQKYKAHRYTLTPTYSRFIFCKWEYFLQNLLFKHSRIYFYLLIW
jgi:hypothetical protein